MRWSLCDAFGALAGSHGGQNLWQSAMDAGVDEGGALGMVGMLPPIVMPAAPQWVWSLKEQFSTAHSVTGTVAVMMLSLAGYIRPAWPDFFHRTPKHRQLISANFVP